MRLTSVTVERFKNFVEPQTFDVEAGVTCLVGKNESGKTTILKALHRLNPAGGRDRKFRLTTEYPRWRLARDRRLENLEAFEPVRARFILEPDDVAALREHLPTLPEGVSVIAGRSYANELSLRFEIDPKDAIDAVAAANDLPAEDLVALRRAESIPAAQAQARAVSKEIKTSEALRAKALSSFATALGKTMAVADADASLDEQVQSLLVERLPRFFYFSNYESLPGECDLTALASKIDSDEALTASENTVVALLAYAGEEPGDFLDDDYDSRKAELQAASSDLSRRAFEYWRQNRDLAVVFDTDNVVVSQRPSGNQVTHRYLKIELRDGRHGDVETNFATRSSGFQWFFSFFAAFSSYQDTDESILVLLDEPGTSLHGEAQSDFIRFIDNELGSSKQTIYTTHSQHMIDPGRYEAIRAVEDRATREDPGAGVVVTAASLSAGRETLLPLESALGYTMSQHLLLGSGHHLLVEGSSDFVYLQRLTEFMIGQGQTGLDPRLAILPVGSVDNMPAFVALLGRRLRVTALIDGANSSRKMARVQAAAASNGVPETSLVACAEVVEGVPRNADIEDLFAVEDYLRLYNWALDASLVESDLPTTDQPLVQRIESLRGKFDHALPAHAFTGRREEFFASISAVTTSRFRSLFERLNSTITDAVEAGGSKAE